MTPEDRNLIEQMIRQAINDHYHTGGNGDGKRLNPKNLQGSPQAAIADVSGTADGTYSGNEQSLINDLKTSNNDILEALRNLGLIRS